MDFPYFLVLAGEDKDRKLPVHPGSGHLLGRHAEASYRIHDLRAARFHCMINSDGGTVTVVDQAGSGGTLVNGAPVSSRVLDHGDTLQVGDTVIRYLTRPMTEADVARAAAGPTGPDTKAVDQLAELSGKELSHFRVGPALGKGSVAMVFRATDTADGKTVALKVMRPDYAKHEEDKQRFIRAMKATMPLSHPNLVRVYAAGQSASLLWAAMELVEGESLAAAVKRSGSGGPSDWRFAFRVALRVGRALAYAYEHGIVHRSVCPASVLVRAADQELKLEGLMLARACEAGPGHPAVRPNELVGDVNYMSPERTTGGAVPVDHRSDLFGLGATCYALLTGRPPFAAGTAAETVALIRTADPTPPRRLRPGVPAPFEAAVLQLLAKHPADRYHSAEELVEELEKVGRNSGIAA